MLYVARDQNGRIRELHPAPQADAAEALAADHPEVLQFIHEEWRRKELESLDREFIRVIEDTLELLMAKNVILFTDLPPKVQEKLMRRREVRQQTHYLGTLGSGDDIIPL
jgi:hypothetical protein